MTGSLLLWIKILFVWNVFAKTSLDYARETQHLTITRDNTDIQVGYGDIIKKNGRRMSYIGNKQWIGEDAQGQWDTSNIEYMPAASFANVHQFKMTGDKLPDAVKKQLETKDKSYYDTYGANSNGFINTIGQGVKIFLCVYIGIIVGVIAFAIAVYIGYYAWDYNLRKLQ
eukprot:892377_1